MTDDPSYSISNSKEIIRNLTLLWKNRCLLTANFGEHESFITTIIDINTKKNTLALDYGPKEYLNKKLIISPNVTFEAEFSGIKAIIPGNKITKSRVDEQAVFQLPIPKTIIWKQRRKFYRVHSPLFNPASCLFTVDEENEINVQLDLHDISLSGMALVYDDPELSKILINTAKFINCKLTLPEIGEGIVSFTIRNEAPLNREKPDKTHKIGCDFFDIKPAFESALQRYIQTVERENKKKM
jgi:c-di-GMP-binding flagellar brake protein YcgR